MAGSLQYGVLGRKQDAGSLPAMKTGIGLEQDRGDTSVGRGQPRVGELEQELETMLR